jgi:hypothetical protein
MTDVPEDVRVLAAATLENDAVRLVLADALQEAGEERMAERCRTVGLAKFELERLAAGTAVTPDRLRSLWREYIPGFGLKVSLAELLPSDWDRERLDACDLVPDAVCSWCYSELEVDVLNPSSTETFGNHDTKQIILFADGSMQYWEDGDWEKGPQCHTDWRVFATDLVNRLRRMERYTYWSDDPDEQDEPDNVPEAYRGLLSHLFGRPQQACEEIGKPFGEAEWVDLDDVDWSGDEIGDWAVIRESADEWLDPPEDVA